MVEGNVHQSHLHEFRQVPVENVNQLQEGRVEYKEVAFIAHGHSETRIYLASESKFNILADLFIIV